MGGSATLRDTHVNLSESMNVTTTLNFGGRTLEAVEFYRAALDAELVFLNRFRDGPAQEGVGPEYDDKVLHATFRIGETTLMASDVGCDSLRNEDGCKTPFRGFSLAVRTDSLEKAKRFFAALSDGGVVQVPPGTTFFAAYYTVVVDRFGVSWKIIVES